MPCGQFDRVSIQFAGKFGLRSFFIRRNAMERRRKTASLPRPSLTPQPLEPMTLAADILQALHSASLTRIGPR